MPWGQQTHPNRIVALGLKGWQATRSAYPYSHADIIYDVDSYCRLALTVEEDVQARGSRRRTPPPWERDQEVKSAAARLDSRFVCHGKPKITLSYRVGPS